MLNPVSEPIVKKVLPALRKVLARKLDRRGYNQSEIAEMLEITQPAVSQYLHGQRGHLSREIEQDEELESFASEIATLMSTTGTRQDIGELYREFCRCLVDKEDFTDILGYNKEYFVDV